MLYITTLDSFSATQKRPKKMAAYKQKAKIKVKFFNPETLEVKTAEMYVTGHKAKLAKDTSCKGLWTVGFTL